MSLQHGYPDDVFTEKMLSFFSSNDKLNHELCVFFYCGQEKSKIVNVEGIWYSIFKKHDGVDIEVDMGCIILKCNWMYFDITQGCLRQIQVYDRNNVVIASCINNNQRQLMFYGASEKITMEEFMDLIGLT
jgi:hypothetical protein